MIVDDVVEAYSLNAAQHFESRPQGIGLVQGAIGDRDLAWGHLEKRPQDAARCAARAEDQHVNVLDRQLEIDDEIAQQADAVGVVARDFPVTEGAYQRDYGEGPRDAFITRILPDATLSMEEQLDYSTFLGGSGDEAPAARWVGRAFPRAMVSSDSDVVVVAASTLGDFGADAQSCAADLQKLTANADARIVEASRNALNRIKTESTSR